MKREIQEWINKNRKSGRFVEKLSEIVDNPSVDFKVGDKVTFQNINGVKFRDLTIIGISNQHELFRWGQCIHLDDDSYWHPVHPDSLTLQK